MIWNKIYCVAFFIILVMSLVSCSSINGDLGNMKPLDTDMIEETVKVVPETDIPETVLETTTETVQQTETTAPITTAPQTEPKGPETQPPASIDSPTYIQGILVVNKTYSLPKTYAKGVDPDAKAALDKMFADAKKEGITFWIASGYRSYDRQNTIYNNYVAKDGKAEADRYSARPGHSEHQTGLAFDLNELTEAFGNSKQGKWLAENCHKYGFIIRYPQNKEHITGYMYEPWHVRYLGVDKATAVYESGLCLEEYLGITSVYS